MVLINNNFPGRAAGYKFARYADDFVIMTESETEAEEAFALVKRILEQNLALELSPEKTTITRVYKGFEFLGFYISSWTVRMRRKSEEKFKDKIRVLTSRSHNLDATVIEKLNRVIRGTVKYFYPPFAKTTSQFFELDKFIRKRLRCMKFKRFWHTDNRRMKVKHFRRLGLLSAKELCLAVKER